MTRASAKSLAEIAEFVQYGYTASASEHHVGPRFLRITDIVPSQIDWDSVPYCEIDEKARNKFSLATGDIVIARTGATVGYAKLIRNNPESVFASYLVRIRVDRQIADPGYVGRIVESYVYKQFVVSQVGGAAQPNANAKILSSFRLPIPDRSTQSRIVEILSAYDDLIENNRRRIQLLEQAVRLLYKEWFVHLRFPGHEHTQIIDGVPEGWKKGVVSDFYDTASGGTPSRKTPEFYGGTIRWVKTQELEDGFLFDTEEHITENAIKKSAAKLFPANTVLIAMYGATIGQVGVIVESSTCNQACCAVMPKAEGTSYEHAFLFFLNNKEGLRNLGQGAAQKNISQQVIRAYEMVLPDKLVLNMFRINAGPFLRQIRTLQSMNQKLAKARDLLLPKLMNGEMAV